MPQMNFQDGDSDCPRTLALTLAGAWGKMAPVAAVMSVPVGEWLWPLLDLEIEARSRLGSCARHGQQGTEERYWWSVWSKWGQASTIGASSSGELWSLLGECITGEVWWHTRRHWIATQHCDTTLRHDTATPVLGLDLLVV